jgi:hypothetical protein
LHLTFYSDHLISNPHAQAPLPSDWSVQPTHPVHHVPYYLAPLWDHRAEAAALRKREVAHKNMKAATNPYNPSGAPNSLPNSTGERGIVPKELREKMKKSKGAKGLLRELEKEIRGFVESWEEKEREKEREREREGLPRSEDLDSDDDEVIFVGRNGLCSDEKISPRTSQELGREKLLLDAPVEDRAASFGYVDHIFDPLVWRDSVGFTYWQFDRDTDHFFSRRFLIHHLGSYYGLRTWSVTMGNPARRAAYVGINLKTGHEVMKQTPLPRPLCLLV